MRRDLDMIRELEPCVSEVVHWRELVRMVALIVIDVPAAAPSEYVAAALRSCNAALGEDRCAARPQHGARFVARLIWDERFRRLTVEFRATAAPEALLLRRELTFSDSDSVRLRWASAGLVVAAFAGARQVSANGAEKARDIPPFASAEDDRTPAVAPNELEPPLAMFGLDALLSAGPALDSGAFSYGASLRFFRPLRLPLFPLLGVRYSVAPDATTVRTWRLGVGLGVRVLSPGSWLGLAIHSELLAEHVTISASEAEREDSAVRTRIGTLLGATFSAAVAPSVFVLVGAEAWVARPEIAVEVGGRELGHVPAFSGAGSAGLRVLLY